MEVVVAVVEVETVVLVGAGAVEEEADVEVGETALGPAQAAARRRASQVATNRLSDITRADRTSCGVLARQPESYA